MKNKNVLEELKKLNPEFQAKITITTNRKSLVEINYINGSWEGKNYFCEASTLWRAAELVTEEMNVSDVITLLENKTISEINETDFSDLQLVESSDGSTEVDDIEWDNILTEEEQEIAPSGMDMYWNGDITDCDYQISPNGIFEMKIETEGFSITINE
jgi:hypothetical protein